MADPETPEQPELTDDQQKMVKALSPEALATLFLVPGRRGGYDPEIMAPPYGKSGVYNIVHDKAGKIGYADLQYDPRTRNVRVNNISAYTDPLGTQPPYTGSSTSQSLNYNAQALGPREMRSLLEDAGRVFPEADTVKGFRVSGARTATPSYGNMSDAYARVPKPPPATPQSAQMEMEIANMVKSLYGGRAAPVGPLAPRTPGVSGGAGGNLLPWQ